MKLTRNAGSRADFLTELRTWTDLPRHPHLGACRHFKTVGDEIIVFAEFAAFVEFVDGGTLADWLRTRKLM